MSAQRIYGRTGRMRSVTNDAYMSSVELANYVGRLCTYQTAYVDPCAGDGALFAVLPDPKCASDITYDPPLNFLASVRSDFTREPMTLVFNPPFTLPNSHRNGVVAFLNHASGLLDAGEYCICVAPATMRKWVNIKRVDRTLHLLEEHVFRRPQVFTVNGRRVKVTIVIQIWRKSDEQRADPEWARSHPDFKLSFQFRPGASFFMNVWGVATRVGRLTRARPVRDGNKWRTEVGTLPMKKSGGGSAVCVYATDADALYERLQQMYDAGVWRAYTDLSCAGNNNPVITNKDIYTMMSHGPDYLKKEKYVQVRYVE